MGQKTNPNIFRLGKIIDWKYKYFEKKSNELSIYTFKNLEIKEFITRFFNVNGLIIHDIKLYYFNDVLHVYISYFLTLKAIFIVNSIFKSRKIKLSLVKNQVEVKYLKNRIKVKKYVKNYLEYEKAYSINSKKNKLFNFNRTINIKKFKRIQFLKDYKKNLLIQKYKNILNIKTNFFLEKLFEIVSLFTNKKTNISFTLKQLNKNIKSKIKKKNQKIIKKKLVKLRKYKQNQFFKNGINILFSCIVNKNSAKLLSKFVAIELQTLKKHNFFLKFVKTTLTLFLKKKIFSKCKGIKIKIKGRFNGAPRAKERIILIGKGVSVLTINSKIKYSENISFTSNGTFGVKVWIDEKI